MNLKKIYSVIIGATLFGAMISCQDLERPTLGDYPKDSNPVGGPLKFYTAFDGTSVDSIRANFGNDKAVGYEAGINGKAYFSKSSESYITYAAPNDFGKATSMTISFWMKAKNPDKGIGAQFVFALPESSHWSKSSAFMLFEDGNQSESGKIACKFMVLDQWLEFVGDNRIPNILNDQWHHLALVYDEKTSVLSLYVDGVAQSRTLTLRKNNQPMGALDFNNTQKFIIGGPGHQALGATKDAWMINYQGGLDQFRLYGKALTASEITALYNGKL